MADEPFHMETEAGGQRPAEAGEPEGATPPGYDWPTHGGYLGCLIGVMFSCLLAPLGYIMVGFLGALLSRPLGGFGIALAVGVTVIAYVAIFIAISRLGWRMGKRFLREYPQPGAVTEAAEAVASGQPMVEGAGPYSDEAELS